MGYVFLKMKSIALFFISLKALTTQIRLDGNTMSNETMRFFFPLKIIRLKDTVIENKLINQYDRENAFIYCDPPYYQTEGHYAVEFRKEDHYRLRDTLAFSNLIIIGCGSYIAYDVLSAVSLLEADSVLHLICDTYAKMETVRRS